MNRKTLRRSSTVILGVALLVATAGTALGQGRQQAQRQPENRQPRQENDRGGPGNWGGGRMGGMVGDMTAPVTTRQVEKYAEVLGLTDEQKATIKMLHEGYAEQARTTTEKGRETMRTLGQEMRESEDREGLMTKMQVAVRETRDARRKQDETFAQDVQAVLTPEQAQKWPTVERMQRRESSMRRGFISGERVDLVNLVEETKVDVEVVRPILEQYEVELDRELIRRNDWQEKQFSRMGELRQEGDFEAIQKLIEEGRELTVKVRDVNRKYARQIENALTDEQRGAFAAGFKRASFPDVYRPAQVSEQIEVAAKLRDLTPEQKERVEALRASHDKAVASINDKLAAAIEAQEMSFNIGNMMQGRGRGEESEAGQLRREKRELNRTTAEALRKVLTAQQAEKLPRPEEEERRGGDRRRGRDEEN
jgi:Spy/CpxP family protein refolding chaperone